MCTEAVIFSNAAPVCIDHLLTAFLGTDAVLPVILVSKASARPTENRDLHLLQSCDHVITHAVCIGNIGILADINPFVNASSQMLGEMTLDLRINVAKFFVCVDEKLVHR